MTNLDFSPRLGFEEHATQRSTNNATLTLEQLIVEVSKKLGSKTVKNGNTYDMDVPTKPGRAQHVVITVVPAPPESGVKHMLYYYSTIGKIPKDLYQKALEMNTQVPFGAFALIKENLVMVDTQILETVQMEEMLLSISSLAVNADYAEEQIFKIDKM